MKILVYYTQNMTNRFTESFYNGLKRHGHFPILKRVGEYVESDLAVMWAYKNRQVIEGQKAIGKDILVLERGYIGDRFKYSSAGFNGLNGRATFVGGNSEDRYTKYFSEYSKLIPWQNNQDGDILLIGQVATDAAVKHINIHDWYNNTIHKLKEIYPNKNIIFRPHPEEKNKYYPSNVSLDIGTKLEDTLNGKFMCVTFSSNSGVIAATNGIPVYAEDVGSMAYSVATKNLSEIVFPDRLNWVYSLANSQWTMEEYSSGEAWESLKHFYD